MAVQRITTCAIVMLLSRADNAVARDGLCKSFKSRQ